MRCTIFLDFSGLIGFFLKTRMVTLTLTWHQPACSSQISYGVVKLDDGELKCHDEAYYFKVVV